MGPDSLATSTEELVLTVVKDLNLSFLRKKKLLLSKAQR
jgi:hypothetical protein